MKRREKKRQSKVDIISKNKQQCYSEKQISKHTTDCVMIGCVLITIDYNRSLAPSRLYILHPLTSPHF